MQGLILVCHEIGQAGNRSALPVLRELQVPATVFVVSGLVGQENVWIKSGPTPLRSLMFASQIREAMAAGVAIGCHSVRHSHLSQLMDAQLHDEVLGARAQLNGQRHAGKASAQRRVRRQSRDGVGHRPLLPGAPVTSQITTNSR